MELKGLKLLLPVLLCLVFACSRSERTPAGILTREEMVRTMMEVYIGEEKVNRLALSRDSSVRLFDSLKVRIFANLGTQDSVFMRSLKYYNDRPRDMEYLYTALVDSLGLREQKTVGIPVK